MMMFFMAKNFLKCIGSIRCINPVSGFSHIEGRALDTKSRRVLPVTCPMNRS
jgi:hypothetical protein